MKNQTNTLFVTAKPVFGGDAELSAYIVLGNVAIRLGRADCHSDMLFYAESEGYGGYTFANVDPSLKLAKMLPCD